jgi:transposase
MTGEARIIQADRSQPRWDMIDLESLVADDHRVRIVWSFVERLDLTPLYAAIKSREGDAGRPAADPRVLLALWLYATVEGVGSARELDRLAERNLPYRWLAGGVPLNYHGLADFRVDHVALLDRLLTESVTALVAEGLVSLDEIAVDGTKVRARASKNSFKTGKRLARIEAAVAERIAALKAEVADNPGAGERRRRAAQLRAARDVEGRAAATRAALDRVQAEKQQRARRHAKDEKGKSEPAVSLTDPDARIMRFADGAMRPAYNAQIAALPAAGVIVSVTMTDRRNDAGLAVPMVEDVVRRYGRAPQRLLVDTHYATREDIKALAAYRVADAAAPVAVYAPPPTERDDVKPATLAKRAKARAREHDSLKQWRARMDSAAGQAIYRSRMLIERINADRKNHGFGFLAVRGLVKAQAVALLHGLAHNLMAAHRLRIQPA